MQSIFNILCLHNEGCEIMGNVLSGIKGIFEFVKEMLLVLLVAMLFIFFVVSHNKIPTQSMVSTINIGDHILTTMVPYYYRDPQPGEIVVFKQGEAAWVKRVIGLPGDIIDIKEGKVFVNGNALDESEYLDEGITTEVPTYLLESEDGIKYPYTVPDNKYFLMGDNRPESQDSRYIGPVDRSNIYGKGWIKVYPFDQIGFLK